MSAAPRQRTVCVVGFHRSGTSLTARLMNVLGVQLGAEADLLPPNETDNARGYWEPRWMTDLNDELLAALGTTWWEPFPGEPGWEASPVLAPLRARAAAVYAEKLGDFELSGWKDPRSTLTLPFWQAIAPEPSYVVCIRNPIDAIASIQRRPEPTLPTGGWGELWLEYTARALQGTAGRRRIVIFYDDYFRDADAQIAQLASLLEVAPGDERIGEARALVEADMRHHRSSAVELAAAPALSAPVRTAFLALRAAQELRRTVGAEDADAIRVCDAIDRVVVDAWRASRHAVATRRQAEALETETRALTAALEATQTHAAGLEARLAQALDALDRAQRGLQVLQGSTSWRVTAPLRAARSRARQGRPRERPV